MIANVSLNLCILVTPKCVLWQTVKTHMECSIIKTNTIFREKEILFYLKIITCDPLIYTMDHTKFNVS